MRKYKKLSRLLALVLVALIAIVPLQVGVMAAGDSTRLKWDYSDITPDPRNPETIDRNENAIEFADDDVVRVSIVLDGDSTIDKGYSTIDIANNKKAIAYRDSLLSKQEAIEAKIEKEVLAGRPLDVEWNLTLVANMISANVKYGQIEAIKAVKGVKDVVLEVKYAPAVAEDSMPVDPQMSTSSEQIGSGIAWAEGYTGAGSTVAIIDTGIDLDHKSFDADAFDYAIAEAVESGKKVDLMDVSDIEDVMDQLNIVKLGAYTGSASGLYQSSKVPFAFNYVDGDLDVTHDNDSQGEHGSHVTGIAAANRYIKDGSEYVDALSSVLTQGVAPDAQIITMKVFGKGGGAYDSDYMAAIEDAIVLGADTVNLSLGSAMAGFSRSDAYESVMNSIVASDTVVTMSAGNSGYWAENSNVPYPYGDDVNFDTAGSPGSFTNSLGVASVDNVGSTGAYVSVGDSLVFYTETTGYRNVPFASLAGDHEYVLIDGIGTDEDFAAVESILEGKIALCYRGTISFYQKAVYAVNHGAIATIIVNNQPGTINMDLTDYPYAEPCVSITYDDGELFWENAVEENELNGVYYATGTMTVGDGVASSDAEKNEDGIYTMSSFSSWGIPGSLTMKPEITAPGGNIYSVNGAVPGGQAYENMSGTSMASPQVTGMAAVVAQYIRENADKFADVELTTRGLINSLLMATAEPIIEADSGSYYSILAQGSGLANVGNAVSADAYIVMNDSATASAADGKVKVELGDDPAKTGVYKYGFTINNTSGTENVYTLDTQMFTQDMFENSGYLLLDTWTIPIDAEVTYTVNGVPFDVDARIDADVDMNGYTNAADAQALLDYIVGRITDEGLDLDAGDLDADGKITTYDAHLLLAGIEARLTVPANGSVEVEVTATITEDLSAYVNGAYIEGYTFVKPVASEEGELDVVYSIPVLGFYGNWSDPSMFDRLDIEGYFYGSDHDIPYTGEITDELDYKDGDDKQTYFLFGNPYVQDEEYHPEREALRNKDTLTSYYYSLIRNAGARLAVVYDADGNVVYSTSVSSEYGAFYYTNGGSWQYTSSNVNLGVKVADLNTKENEQFTFAMYAIPEYYLTAEMYEDGVITLDEALSVVDQLGNGAVVSKSVTVDNTAPKFVGEPMKSLTSGDLKIKVKDNQYIAYAVALNRSGTMMFADITADDLAQTEAGKEVELTFSGADLAAAGEYVAIAVYDYAGNMSVIEVKYGEHVNRVGKMYGFTSSLFTGYNTWIGIDPATVNITATADDGYALEDLTTFAVASAEYIDGYIFQADANGNLYVAPEADFGMTTLIGNMGVVPIDMAYDYDTNNLYALVTATTNNVANKNVVYKINPLTGKATVAFYANATNTSFIGTTYVTLFGMAIDDEGTFYFDGSSLYTVANWDGATTAPAVTKVGASGGMVGGGTLPTTNSTMAWDHNTDTLYMVSKSTVGNANNYLAIVDTTTGKYTRANGATTGSQLYAPFTALFIAPGLTSGEDFTPTDKVDSITVAPEEMKAMVGGSYQLTAQLTPWTLTDMSVTWTSSDESVAVVDELGFVTAVGVGSATITVTSVADPTKSATSTIEVLPLPSYDLKGLVYDTDSVAYWSSFNTQDPASFKHLAKGNYYYAGSMTDYGYLVTHDGSAVYLVDPTDFAAQQLFEINPTYLFPDAALNMYFAATTAGEMALLAPQANSKTLMIFLPLSAGLYTVNLGTGQNPITSNIAAITWVGLDSSTQRDYYYMLLENGDLYILYLSAAGNIGLGNLGNIGMDITGAANPDGGSSASLIYDWDNFDEETGTEYLYLAHYEDNADSAYLSVIQVGEDVGTMASVSFGENVWPAVSLYSSFEEEMFVMGADASERFADVNFTEVNAMSELKSAVATKETESTNAALTGSLNAITVDQVEVANGEKKAIVIDEDAKTATLTLNVDDSTNGLVAVNYDADLLTLESTTAYLKNYTDNAENGVLKFAYAGAGELDGTVKLVFSYEDQHGGLDTTITVRVLEDGEPTDEVVTIMDIPVVTETSVGDHVWGAPTFTWSENGTSAYATFTCQLDHSHTMTVDADVTGKVTKEATATEAGTMTYTATVVLDGVTYTATKNVEIPALGTKPVDPPTIPNTASGTEIALWVVLILMLSACAVFVSYRKIYAKSK
ncbi:MAG: S8 family serine peptidase [Oscillospiraceae bacterium]|nr:S8 family serine peptidase [Oscillospiraceae bacterium]